MDEKEFEQTNTCPLCGNLAKDFKISAANLRFLQSRGKENNINDALIICATAWSVFPELRYRSDSKNFADILLDDIQKQLSKSLVPLEMIVKMTTPLSQKLDELIEKLPGDVKQQFQGISVQLSRELKLVQEVAINSVQPIQKDVKQLSETLNMLVFKPSVKGAVSERTLEISWQEAFVRDEVEKRGGPGAPDLVVAPYLVCCDRIGERIIVERKSGRQRYCGADLQQTLRLAKKEGARFGVLVYDSPDNLVEKPIFLTMIENVCISVCDVQTNGWKVSRQAFEIIQAVMPNYESNTPCIDFTKLERIVEEMHCVNNSIELLRKSNNAAINNCQKNQELINSLEQTFSNYRQKLLDFASLKKSREEQTHFH